MYVLRQEIARLEQLAAKLHASQVRAALRAQLIAELAQIKDGALHASPDIRARFERLETIVYSAGNQPPSISAVSPPLGPIAGGYPITITGSRFTGATSVTIGGTLCGAVVVVNDNTITCTTPAKATNIYNLAVTTPAGTTTAVGAFASVDMAGWFRADLGVTDVAGHASAWADQAANANATQATAGKRPLINISVPAYHNQATLGFDSATSQVMHTAAYGVALVQPLMLICVGNSDGSANAQEFLDGLATRSIIDVNESVFPRYEGFSGTFIPALGPGIDAAPHIMAWEGNGAVGHLYVDAITAIATGNGGANGLDGLSIGGSPGDTVTLNGQIAEAMVVRGLPSNALRAFIFNYLSARYALAIGP